MPGGNIQLVAKPHPFDADTVYVDAEAGSTIAELVGYGVSKSCRVTIGGIDVPRALWPKLRPKPGQRVHITMYPQGGSDDGKMILKIIVVAVISYFTLGAGGAASGSFLGLTGGAAYAAGTAFFIAGVMAVNALIPPPTPKGLGGAGGDPFEQLNSLTGTSNQASPYGVIPCVVGQKRFFPPHAALPYTEISGDDQYLRMLLDLGYGDLDISDIQIGETPISAYDDVEWEVTRNPTLFAQDVYELQVAAALNELNDTVQRTTQSNTTEISLDLVFGQGLFGVDEKGKTTSATTHFAIQYRKSGSSGEWKNIGGASGLTFSGGLKLQYQGSDLPGVQVQSTKRKTLRCGVRWKVPAGQYDVVVTRGSVTYGSGTQDNAKFSNATWTVMRSISPQAPTTTNTLKLAVRIKATDQLNGVVQNLSVLAAQRVRRWDASNGGQWLPPAASTNPAWIYLWLLTQCPAVARRLDDRRVDYMQNIALWAADCDAKGLKVGFVMDSGRAFGDVLRDVLSSGLGSFGLRNGLYSVVRDTPQSVPVQMFTPANSWDFSYSRQFIEPPHALRVKFTNPEANDQQDTRIVYWDGYSESGGSDTIKATKFEELDARQCIDPNAAWVLGRYHLASMHLRPTIYTWMADIENLVCERGDLVMVSYDLIGWGHAWGRVKAVDGATVTLDGPVTLEPDETYAFRVRQESLAQFTEIIATGAGDHQQIRLKNELAGVDPGDLFIIGKVNHGSLPLIITKIEPDNDLTAKITAQDADPGMWTATEGVPPPFASEISGKSWCAPPLPPSVHIRSGNSAPDDAGVINAETGVSNGNRTGGIYRFPNIPGGGGGCPDVNSMVRMADGTSKRAGDIVAGDIVATADPLTLQPGMATVRYSEPKHMPCVEVETRNRSLVCSISAPLPTRGDGLRLAPDVAGREVATLEGWHSVTVLRSAGSRLVQHIDINDGCFWCNGILHHNKRMRAPDPGLDNRNDMVVL